MDATAVINVLPSVGNAVQIYFTVILSDNTLNQATITNCTTLYGNVYYPSTSIFIAQNGDPIAIAVTATLGGATYVSILYTKAILQQAVPDNFSRIVQKIPLGVFTAGIEPAYVDGNGTIINPGTIVGNDMYARSRMVNDYYQQYYFVVNQVYASTYSPQLEYEYNGTVGLFTTSVYPVQLFHILTSAATVYLNSYDLELFVSKYIYYRLGTVSAVYIDDHVTLPGGYWNLGIVGSSEMGITTILAPEQIVPIVENLVWQIFNSSAWPEAFFVEIIALVTRMSRADIGNNFMFFNDAHPTAPNFTLIGPTYFADPRLLYNKCLEYIGDGACPLNIIGYQRNY